MDMNKKDFTYENDILKGMPTMDKRKFEVLKYN